MKTLTLLALSLLSYLCLAKTSPANFLKDYLGKKGITQKQEAFKNMYNDQSLSFEKFYESNLYLRPNFRSTDYTFPRGDFDQRNYGFNLGLNQSFSTGTDIALDFDYQKAERSDAEQKQENSNWSITLNQSLLRNWNSAQKKTQRQLEGIELKRQQSSLQIEQMKECHEGLSLYNKNYFYQEQMILMKEIKQRSQDLFYINNKRYKKKLINKLNYLLAKRNWQESKNNYDQARIDFEQGNTEFSFYHSGKNLSELVLEIPSFDSENNFTLKNKQELLNYYKSQQKLIQSRYSYDLSLRLRASGSEKRNDYSFSVEGDNKSDAYSLSLNLDIPFSNPRKKIEESKNTYEQIKAQVDIDRFNQDFNLNKSLYTQSLKKIESKISQLKATLKTNAQLLKEAKYQLKINQLSLRNYLEYLNQYLNNKRSILQCNLEYNRLILDYANNLSSPLSVCKRFIQ